MNVSIELIKEPNNCYIYGKNDKDDGVVTGYSIFKKWFEILSKLTNEFPDNKIVKLLMSALWGHICRYDSLIRSDEENLKNPVDKEYFIHDILFKRDGTQLNKLINKTKAYRFGIGRLKPFLLSRGRAITGKIALEHIDDVIRIHTDNVTFDKQHDDVINRYKTFGTLCKEEKTSGKIHWYSVNCYKNFTTCEETKNYPELEWDEIYD